MAHVLPVPSTTMRWILPVLIVLARLILAGGARHAGFVELPLVLVAMILTATPGSAGLEYDPERGILPIQVFDMVDPEEWRSLIRDRCETLLMEAFG